MNFFIIYTNNINNLNYTESDYAALLIYKSRYFALAYKQYKQVAYKKRKICIKL